MNLFLQTYDSATFIYDWILFECSHIVQLDVVLFQAVSAKNIDINGEEEGGVVTHTESVAPVPGEEGDIPQVRISVCPVSVNFTRIY
jgi:hypothetical protein